MAAPAAAAAEGSPEVRAGAAPCRMEATLYTLADDSDAQGTDPEEVEPDLDETSFEGECPEYVDPRSPARRLSFMFEHNSYFSGPHGADRERHEQEKSSIGTGSSTCTPSGECFTPRVITPTSPHAPPELTSSPERERSPAARALPESTILLPEGENPSRCAFVRHGDRRRPSPILAEWPPESEDPGEDCRAARGRGEPPSGAVPCRGAHCLKSPEEDPENLHAVGAWEALVMELETERAQKERLEKQNQALKAELACYRAAKEKLEDNLRSARQAELGEGTRSSTQGAGIAAKKLGEGMRTSTVAAGARAKKLEQKVRSARQAERDEGARTRADGAGVWPSWLSPEARSADPVDAPSPPDAGWSILDMGSDVVDGVRGAMAGLLQDLWDEATARQEALAAAQWDASDMAANLEISSDGRRIRFAPRDGDGCVLRALAFTREPMELRGAGYGFEVLVVNVRAGSPNEIAIGFSALPPKARPRELPESADGLERTWLAGYEGEALAQAGREVQWISVDWRLPALKRGDCLGAFAAFGGQSAQLLVNGAAVGSIPIEPVCAYAPLWGVLDLLGGAGCVEQVVLRPFSGGRWWS